MMRAGQTPKLHLLGALALLLCIMAAPARPVLAQSGASATKPDQAGGTFRVRVGLVQVDLTVIDKKGVFIDDLKPDQVELSVDGVPQPISFLELISTLGPAEERALAGSRSRRAPAVSSSTSSRPDTGRTILFFLDDWHLSPESIMRSRETLARLIDSVMGPNDQAAVFTASRQLGFLQQVTDNKTILKQALTRLDFTNEAVRDLSRPTMNEAQALAIEQEDPQIFQYFVDVTMAVHKMLEIERAAAEELVRFRASGVAETSAAITARSLASLRSVLRSCAVLPGRKVIFYLSDGFVLQQQKDDVAYRLKQVTEAALNAGIVIYSLDTRGLTVELPNDMESMKYVVPPQDLRGGGLSEVMTGQDGLNALASDTGGRLLGATNAYDQAIVEGLEEASRYYLLGWYVDQDKLQPGRYSSVRVRIKDRPDLKVQVRQSSLDLYRLVSEEKDRAALAAPRNVKGKELSIALQYPWPISGLPASLYSGFVYDPVRKGYVLGILFQVDLGGVDLPEGSHDGRRVDLLGIVANRDGKTVGSFEVNPSKPADPSNPPKWENNRLTYSRVIPIEPGIYQVRVAALEPKTGRVGSAHQWVEVVRPSAGAIQLGSIFLKEPAVGPSRQDGLHPETFDEREVSAERRFRAGVRLPFLFQILHDAGNGVLVETRIYRGNQVVKRTVPESVAAAPPDDSGPLFIGGQLSTDGLSVGPYVLEVSAADPAQKTAVTQRIPFWIR